jgi:hypothetical protein
MIIARNTGSIDPRKQYFDRMCYNDRTYASQVHPNHPQPACIPAAHPHPGENDHSPSPGASTAVCNFAAVEFRAPRCSPAADGQGA